MMQPTTVLSDAPALAAVESGFLAAGGSLPLVLRPVEPGLDAAAWAGANAARLGEELLRYGAILFRGFEVPSVAAFERLAGALCPDLFADYGDLPREALGEKVYESTPYPADKAILFHNESSHLHRWPAKQFFYCVTAALERGETPIVDCREIYRRLDPQVARQFEERKLMYVRNFVEGLDVPWQTFFHTSDRRAVEIACGAAGMEAEWTDDDGLRLRHVAPAVIRHPRSGEKCFFNQMQLHHVSYLNPEVRSSLIDLYGEEGLPRNVFYGDGSPIPDALLAELEDLYWRTSVAFPWQPGDVLMVDNMIVAHARNPFVGPRKMVVAMGELVSQTEIG
jgi:alpha-ketoglutarate-dependent taurine dioxygenase